MCQNSISYKLNEAEFVAGEDELCFQRVLDDFPNAEYINVLTYNISARNDNLLTAIRNAAKCDIPINIITNIPSRWDWYGSTSLLNKAKKNIKLYERKLNPEALGRRVNVFFKFNNHAKIIMTNNIIYWGSANYSDESKQNYECGTISTDKQFIKFIQNEVITAIIANTTSYYSFEYNKCLLGLFSAISAIHNIHEEIYDASYNYRSDYDTSFEERFFFNPYDNYLRWEMLESYTETIVEFNNMLQALQDDLEENNRDYDKRNLSPLVKDYERFISMKNGQISELCEKIRPLVCFDEEEYVQDLLQGEFYREAYDEKLDYYAQLASDMGREKKSEYIASYKDDVIALLKALDEYEPSILKFIERLMEIAKVNDEIDNT